MIYCTQCGNENDDAAKFCRNCGAKLEQTVAQAEDAVQEEQAAPVYEKITDAEEEKPAQVPYQDSTQNSYGSNSYSGGDTESNRYYDAQTTSPYYSANPTEQKQGGGNIGFAIASLVCGILSMLCCCLTLFSLVLGIAAIVLGIITICFKYDGKGMAIAGIVTGGLGLIIGVVALVWSGSVAAQDWLDYYDFY